MAAWPGKLWVSRAISGCALNAMCNGFAAVFTNTGHDAATEPAAEWAYNDPEREGDYDLVSLVPKPRVNLTRFHGVFAPNSS